MQIEGFKRCYEEVPNLLYDVGELNKDNSNNNKNFTDDNDSEKEKYYINYFYVNLSKKIGTRQKIRIPKTFYIVKNLCMLKRTNLNRGR